MGTKVEVKNNSNNNNNSNSYFPGYYSMRDLNNEDSSSNSWPQFYSDNNSYNNSINANGPVLNNGFFPPGYDRDSVKQTMLQHEAIFKHQVIELHRVYRIQRDMMEDFRRRELQKHVVPLEMSSSSSPVAPRLLDANKWRKSSFSGRGQSVSGAEVITSKQTGLFPCGDNFEDCEILDSRPSKVMKRLFDLQLPPDQQYIDSEGENSPIRERDSSKQGCFRGIADLNEPAVLVDEGTVTGALNLNGKAVVDLTGKSKSPFFVGFQNENRCGNNSSFFENKGKRSDWLPHINEAVKGNNKTNLNLIPESSSEKLESINGFETSRQRKQDRFIDRRVPWLSGNPIRNVEPAQATSSSLNRNGYYHGSSSVPKGSTPPGFPSVGRTINCRSNHFDLPDLNKISYDGFFNHEDDGKKQPDEEQHVVAAAALPWLKTKVADEKQHVGNILGFPIPSSKSKDEPLPSQDNNNGSKAWMIDINVAYDSDSEKTTPPKEVDAINSRFLIDLNSCLSDDEIPSPPLNTSRNSLWRGGVQIDLEAPPAEEPDFGDDIIEEEEDNTRTAAEAIVAISTTAPISDDNEKTSWLPLGEDSMEDPLSWFAEEVLISSTPPPPPQAKVIRRSVSSLLDEFEMMTLNLPELKEEEYMPKPLVQILNREEDEMDEAGTGTVSSIANRTRRGPGRRGRQRRDFQRDILPGLASLSRNEVTEDIQTFGGLMRATGHQWQSGVTRRNGSRNGSGRGRGRRPNSVAAAVQVTTTSTGPSSSTADCTQLIQQMSCADDVWGKTPRRPRRQRSCPQGNNPPQTTVLLA